MDLINVMQEPTNLIDAANWAGWVPPVKSDWTIPVYANFAAPFNQDFGNLLPSSTRAAVQLDVQRLGPGHSSRRPAPSRRRPSTTGAAGHGADEELRHEPVGPERRRLAAVVVTRRSLST